MISKERVILIIFSIFTPFMKCPVTAGAVNYTEHRIDLYNTNTPLPGDIPSLLAHQDSVKGYILPQFIKKAPYRFSSRKKQEEYNRMVRDVKKTLPYAKEISGIILETYEYMETLPDDKARQTHLEKMEKFLYQTYKPKMSKLTRSQGQLLIKLVDRETNSSSYKIVDAFMGSFKAWSYNLFASLFGNSLKKRFDAHGDDYMIECICKLYEDGLI